ncbi:MAG: class I SAM-dependent methyltransferase, partial [Candidatus Subteraquimicrobiales bacterium]|nr:class I SAM-dependent methyltransferase [Candidatus Subteraquimicrobiales bacterium]
KELLLQAPTMSGKVRGKMSEAKEFVGPLLGRDRVQSYAKYLLRSGRIKKVYLPFIEEVLGRIGYVPEKILDLGTGPGFLAMEFAKKLPYSQVVGLDLSNDMLAYAKREAKKEGLKNISFFFGRCSGNAF